MRDENLKWTLIIPVIARHTGMSRNRYWRMYNTGCSHSEVITFVVYSIELRKLDLSTRYTSSYLFGAPGRDGKKRPLGPTVGTGVYRRQVNAVDRPSGIRTRTLALSAAYQLLEVTTPSELFSSPRTLAANLYTYHLLQSICPQYCQS